ncbi:MAG TPA: helicase, partial [Flavobacteriales bacterium]|nr:helicase [Flavobacteriales bacterium]
MSAPIKNLDAILKKLGIRELNAMQKEAYEVILENPETIILSPTGTGKTLAFLLPLLEDLDRTDDELQAMILVPSRELAMQIEQVAREIGSGYKINAV